MRFLLMCRRTYIASLSIGCLTALGIAKGFDVSLAIATVSAALGASNAYEKSAELKGKESARVV